MGLIMFNVFDADIRLHGRILGIEDGRSRQLFLEIETGAVIPLTDPRRVVDDALVDECCSIEAYCVDDEGVTVTPDASPGVYDDGEQTTLVGEFWCRANADARHRSLELDFGLDAHRASVPVASEDEPESLPPNGYIRNSEPVVVTVSGIKFEVCNCYRDSDETQYRRP